MQKNGLTTLAYVATMSLTLLAPVMHIPSVKAETECAVPVEHMKEEDRIKEATALFTRVLNVPMSKEKIGWEASISRIIELLRGTKYDALARALENVLVSKNTKLRLIKVNAVRAPYICQLLQDINAALLPAEIIAELERIKSEGGNKAFISIVSACLAADA